MGGELTDDGAGWDALGGACELCGAKLRSVGGGRGSGAAARGSGGGLAPALYRIALVHVMDHATNQQGDREKELILG